ncbi:MAG: tRNA uridine-5-carboxymethylaminomethyl(34) synthesis GTPase MnmE [Syntrophomonas sp.]|nr:tRNA uridine-5-carboxymethylaminomethyl(34) synthesis GTPase MnmE [Syntrophomonas sp.]
MFREDIAALSTPPGEGGIGIIRVSGKGIIDKISKIFIPFSAQEIGQRRGFSLNLGWIIDDDGSKVDEVLLGIMRAPHSYTGEDVIEINCHGGSMPIRRCLQRCLDVGIKLAEPGEFTKRAYLNGRLDLTQAEAVIDIIRAKTDRGLKLAVQQLEGPSHFIAEIEDQLLRVNAMLEASLDFPEEVGDLDYAETKAILLTIKKLMDKLIRAGQRSEIYRDGLKAVICGKPNVGKSSLLNALVKKEKAIVTEIPGTTRDVVEDYINIRGIPVRIMDTAGIRQTEDIVEKIGVEKTREVIEQADLILFVLDAGTGIDKEDMDIFQEVDQSRLIVMVNKEDLERKEISEEKLAELFRDIPVIRASVQKSIGIEALEEAVESRVIQGMLPGDGMEIMINLRQKNALIRSREQVESALITLGQVPLDCLGVDIGGALETMGEISGRTLKDEVIDRIFHDFCIGK